MMPILRETKRLLLRSAFAVSFLGASFAGCGDGATDAESGAGGVAGLGGENGVGGSGGGASEGETVTLLLDVVTASLDGPAPPAKGPPLEGVRVCEMGTDNCKVTGPNGKVTLDLPADREVAYTLEREGYGPRVISDVTDEDFPSSNFWEMFTDEQLGAIAAAIDTPYPWSGGILGLNIGNGPIVSLGGAKVAIVDGTGKCFYLEDVETWLYSSSLESTRATVFGGFRPLAVGGFAEVTPGVHEFEVVEGVGCEVAQGWPSDEPNRIRVPIIEGFNSYGSIGCQSVDAP